MRTTISIPDALAEKLRLREPGSSFSELARRALAEHLERLERQELASVMVEGYRAEAASPSLDDGWSGLEAEGWE